MTTELIITIINGLVIVLVAWINKKDNRKVSAESDIIRQSVAENANQIQVLTDKERENSKSHKFRQEIQNLINEIATTKITESENLMSNDILVSGLTEYFEQVSYFALKFFYSGMRKNKKITKEQFQLFLKNKLNLYMTNLIQAISNGVKVEKALTSIKSRNKKFTYVLFSEFFATAWKDLKQPDCFDLNDILADDLSRNGLTEDTTIQRFAKYTNNFIDTFKKIFLEFLKLENYDKVLEANQDEI